jgi:hypothetical protein
MAQPTSLAVEVICDICHVQCIFPLQTSEMLGYELTSDQICMTMGYEIGLNHDYCCCCGCCSYVRRIRERVVNVRRLAFGTNNRNIHTHTEVPRIQIPRKEIDFYRRPRDPKNPATCRQPAIADTP